MNFMEIQTEAEKTVDLKSKLANYYARPRYGFPK